jgi:hypothetical protein
MDTIKIKKERKPRKVKEPVLEKENDNIKELQNNDLTAKIEQLMNVEKSDIKEDVKDDVPLEPASGYADEIRPPKLKREETITLPPKITKRMSGNVEYTTQYPPKTITVVAQNDVPSTDDDVINIGKFKNQNFKILKNPENHTYCVWLARQKRPAYQSLSEYCRNYVKQNPLNIVPVKT